MRKWRLLMNDFSSTAAAAAFYLLAVYMAVMVEASSFTTNVIYDWFGRPLSFGFVFRK